MSLFDDDGGAVARLTDPAESHAAAASVNQTRGQIEVLRIMRAIGRPTTDEELVELAPLHDCTLSPSGVRTRRMELVRAGKVVRVGTSRTRSNRSAAVWASA